MNSTRPKIHLCKLDSEGSLNQEIIACEKDVIAFCQVGDVVDAEIDFAAGHFGVVSDSVARAAKDNWLGGAKVSAWAECVAPDGSAKVRLRLLVEEPQFGGMIHRYGTFTVNKSNADGRQPRSEYPINTLIDLDDEFAAARQSSNVISIPIHVMPAHIVFYRKAEADLYLSYLVQEVPGQCFEHTPASNSSADWEVERADDKIVNCFFPKGQGHLQFMITAFEQKPYQQRKLIKKFVIEAFAV